MMAVGERIVHAASGAYKHLAKRMSPSLDRKGICPFPMVLSAADNFSSPSIGRGGVAV